MSTELEQIIEDWGPPEDYLPAELLLNDDHPTQDQWFEDKRQIEQKIYAFGRQMRPEKRELARLIRSSLKTKDIAKRLDRSVATIYKWAKDPDVIRLAMLIDHLQRLIDGADADHRKGVLWRIALDNEEKRPNVAIQALQEINKMSGVYQNTGNQGNGNVFNIQINGELLPRGPLDQMPETFETKQLQDGTFTRSD